MAHWNMHGRLVALTIVWLISLAAAASAVQPSSERFTLTLNGEAVKDNATGLIWEQAPDRIFDVWSASVARCATKTVGGQKGWRAPTVDELKTLLDPDRRDPALPEGHPFANIRSDIFWTSTPHTTDDILAWYVSFFTGQVISDQKSQTRRVWCMLGPASGASKK